MSVQNYLISYPIATEIYQSGPKWWTERPTSPPLEPSSYSLCWFLNLLITCFKKISECKHHKRPHCTHQRLFSAAAGSCFKWKSTENCGKPQTKLPTNWWTKSSIQLLKSQIFPSGVDEDQNWAKNRLNIDLTIVRWTQTRLQMNANVSLCQLDV